MKNGLIKSLLQNQFIVAILFVVLGWFALEMRDIIASLFISYILMASLLPYVEFLRKRKIPKTLAVVITYFAALALVVLIIFPLIPFFSSQIQSLITGFPDYLDKVAHLLGIKINIQQINSFISGEIANIGKSAYAFTSQFLGGLFSVLTILVVSFYLLLDHESIRESFARLFPKSSEENIILTLKKVEEKLGAWVRGQIILSLVIGVISWIFLTLLGLPFALSLAVLAGILEIVPIVGPILSSIPAVIVGFAISPTMGLIVAVFYLVVQMIENNVLVPKIMQRAVGLNPVVVILGIMVGARLMSITGALLSVPFISMLVIIFKTLKQSNK